LCAVFGELPLTAILIGGTLRIVGLNLPPFSRKPSIPEFTTGRRSDGR
jgi:hypothetical protein